MTIGRAVFWVLLGLTALSALAFAALLAGAFHRLTYDANDPDYSSYSGVFARLREQLD